MNNLSIIIPVKQNDETWKELVQELLTFNGDFEIILIGPDFKDKKSENLKIRFEFSKQGRALQQNQGARVASKTFIWFLHADSRLSNRPLQTIEEKIKQHPEAIYFFDLNFLTDGPRFMILNSIGAYWRSHLLKMPFGDQGFFMARRTFFSLGMFDENVKYGEDHLFVWKAHIRNVPVLPASAELFTSARKYNNLGWITTTLKHVVLTYKQAFPQWIKYLRTRNKKRFTTAIVIFVKTPNVSPIKTRLAKDIGKDKAEEFYRLSLKATEALVIEAIKKSNGKIEAYWAVNERDQLHNPLWNSFKTIYQGSGGLGEKIATIYSRLQKKHKRVFLIGADLPHLDYKILLHAQHKLSSFSEYVMGETEDGGFYLFGARGIIERAVWTSIPYSSNKTATVVKNKLGPKNFILLEKNFDIDYIEDLRKLSTYPIDNLLPEQLDVIDWIKKNSFNH